MNVHNSRGGEAARRREAAEAADAALLALAPALNAYVRRVGAVRKNFCKFVVEAEREATYHGMRREIARITIDRDTGSVECNVKDYAPTEAEAAAIAAELVATRNDWPRSIATGEAAVRELQTQLRCGEGDFFAFRAQQGHEYLFVQQRINNDAGEKTDLPWSFWSDGIWRCMEPDGLLPLYGLEQLASGYAIMIHEGAKAAKQVRAMCDDESPAGRAALAAHPWGEALKRYVHLGWPGGANNAHRVDWDPTKNLPADRRVVLVADHDQVGENAITTISSILRRRMEAIRFDDYFPPAFDLADPWPTNEKWWRGPVYKGPALEDLLTPATWATDVVHGKGRPAVKVRDEFAKEWLTVTDPAVFVLRAQPNKLLVEKSFNRLVRPFSDVDDTARLMVKKLSSQCAGVIYAPGEGSGVISREGARLINTHLGSSIKAVQGDAGPFIEFMCHLVPEASDRHELLKWCATLIARPDVRPYFGVLMISEKQGVGKSTLGEAILAPLLGRWNVSIPNEKQITDSGFNSWIAHKRMAIVHEIYAGHSSAAYNRLKDVLTETRTRINEKYMPEYDTEICITIFACSNSTHALKLEDEDRRWLVPRVTEETKPHEFWKEFYHWLNGEGLGIIKHWAEQFVRQHGHFDPGEHAPWTSLKKEVIAAGRSQGQQLAFDLGERVVALGRGTAATETTPAVAPQKIVLAVEDVRQAVHPMIGRCA